MRWKNGSNSREMMNLKHLMANEHGNAKRIILLVVLLLVLAAAAVFLLFPDLISPPEPEPKKAATSQVKRKVVQLPKKPADQQAAAKKAAAQKPDAQKPDAQKAAAQKAAAQKPDAQKAAAQKAAAQKAAAQKAAAQKAAAQKAAAQKAAAQKAAAQKAAAQKAAAPKGPYTVTAGAFLMQSSVTQADKIIQNLGHSPSHSKVKRDIEVVRLKEGTYGESEARARLAQYKREFGSDAFVMKKSGGWTVYLGSYVGLDRARIHADRLYAQGVRVSEEKAVVPMELTLVRFGDFPDQAAASQMAVKAKNAGLDAYASKVK